MNAFDYARELLTFHTLQREEAITAEDKIALYRDMYNRIPPEMAALDPGARKVLVRALGDALVQRPTVRAHANDFNVAPPQAAAQAAKAHPSKPGHAPRK